MLPCVALLRHIARYTSITGINIDNYTVSDGFLSQEEIKKFSGVHYEKSSTRFYID